MDVKSGQAMGMEGGNDDGVGTVICMEMGR